VTDPRPAAVSAPVVAGTAPRRLHPLTPVLEAWKIMALLVVLVGRQGLEGDGGLRALLRHRSAVHVPAGALGLVLSVVVLLLAVVVLAVALSVPQWLVRRFWIDGRELHVRSGLVRRAERNLRLDRIQAVDIDQPLRARLFGLAVVRVTMAAGQGASTRLAYLSLADAAQLRDRLLATSAGLNPLTPAAPEFVVATVPPRLVAASAVLAAVPGVVVLIAVGVTGLVMNAPFAFYITFIPILGALAALVWRRVNAQAGFTLARSPDGYRVRSGLLDRRAQTVPPHRVQAVRVHRPLLWRPFGWARVEVDVAGLSGRSGRGRGAGRDQVRGTDLLPLGPVRQAEDIVAGILGVHPRDVPLTSAPRRARLIDPLGARIYAAALTDDAVVGREGVLTRRWTAVPYARIQSVRVRQGPVERLLRLASVHVDSPRGPVHLVLVHRDAAAVPALLSEIVERARAGRGRALADSWMEPR
jgi:putative membrane protein